jgi:hypothetical protein
MAASRYIKWNYMLNISYLEFSDKAVTARRLRFLSGGRRRFCANTSSFFFCGAEVDLQGRSMGGLLLMTILQNLWNFFTHASV